MRCLFLFIFLFCLALPAAPRAAGQNIEIDSAYSNVHGNAVWPYGTPTLSPVDNTVTIKTGGDVLNVYGASCALGEEVTRNTAIVNDGKVGGIVHGGWADEGVAIGNSAFIKGGSVAGSVIGGFVKGNLSVSSARTTVCISAAAE